MKTKNGNGTLDLWHILKRRRVTFERWCEENGVHTQVDFLSKRDEINNSGEYFVSEEMSNLGMNLPTPEELQPSFPKYEDDSQVPETCEQEPKIIKKRFKTKPEQS